MTYPRTILPAVITILLYLICWTNVGAQSTQHSDDVLAVGDSLLKNDKFDQAYQFFSEASSELTGKLKCMSLLKAGYALYRQEEYVEALVLYEKSRELAFTDRLDTLMMKSLTNLGATYTKLGNLNKGVESYRLALGVSDSLGDDFYSAVIQYNLGYNYKEKGFYDQAIVYLFSAVKGFEELDIKKRVSQSYQTLGNVFRYLEKDSLSLVYHYKALRINEDLEDTIAISSSLQDLGNTYKQLSDYDNALKCYKESLLIADSTFKATTFGNMAEVYHELDEYEKARSYYLGSIELKRERADVLGVAHSLTKLGGLYLKLQEYANASHVLTQSEHLAETVEDQATLLTNYELQQQLGEATGDIELAYSALLKYTELRELVFNENKQKTIEQITAEFELKDLEKQNQLLSEESKLSKALAEKEQVSKERLATGLASSIVLLVLLGIVYIQSRKYARWQEAKRREIQHRTKNSLQTLISLFRFQEKYAVAPGEQALLKQGLSRVDTIIMIHRALSEDTEVLNFTKFVKELVKLNHRNYQLEVPNLSVEWQTNKIEVNPDQATLLGLIVNELVNNAFKYAFTNNHAPTLRIGIESKDGTLHMTIQDNGPGLGAYNTSRKDKSEGLELVELFAKQLKAEFSLKNQEGTLARLDVRIEPTAS